MCPIASVTSARFFNTDFKTSMQAFSCFEPEADQVGVADRVDSSVVRPAIVGLV
jgi:hypothetical protein